MVSLTRLFVFLLLSGPESGAIFFTWVMVSEKTWSEFDPWREEVLDNGAWKLEEGDGGGRWFLGYLLLQFWSVAGKLSTVSLCKSLCHLLLSLSNPREDVWLASSASLAAMKGPNGGGKKALSSDAGSDTVTLGSSLRMWRILSASVNELPPRAEEI